MQHAVCLWFKVQETTSNFIPSIQYTVCRFTETWHPHHTQQSGTLIPSIAQERKIDTVMGCTASSMLSGRRCYKEDHDVVLKLGTVVVHDSIHMMIERDRRRKAHSTTTVASSGYRARTPHPLLSSRQATTVLVSEDDTIVVLEDDFMSSSNTITPHDDNDAYRSSVTPLRSSSSILPDI
jgi:hypothetical protein